MSTIAFTVLGRPAPAGSKRAFPNPRTGGVIVADDSKRSRPWKSQVAWEASEAADGLLQGPLALDVVFVLARPKSHWRTGANSHLLRASAPVFPTVKPDATKLLRAVEDACTGIIWTDDAQVVDQRARKVYGVPERCVVRVRRLEAVPAPAVLVEEGERR